MPSPSPRLAPVTRTLRQFAGRGDVERRHDRDGDGHLVARQGFAAERQYVVLDSQLAAGTPTIGFQHDIGNYDRAGDRTLFRPHQRHSDLWMPVDNRLDLLRMDLQSPDIDDATAAASKDVTIAASLHHVAGIDEPITIAQARMLR